jgi:hypothetical protein
MRQRPAHIAMAQHSIKALYPEQTSVGFYLDCCNQLW